MGCRTRRPAQELVRIVVDPTGGLVRAASSAGRGAWLCPTADCAIRASTRGGLARALRAEVRVVGGELVALVTER